MSLFEPLIHKFCFQETFQNDIYKYCSAPKMFYSYVQDKVYMILIILGLLYQNFLIINILS